eukprot:3001064-Amphidinium_carterae.1
MLERSFLNILAPVPGVVIWNVEASSSAQQEVVSQWVPEGASYSVRMSPLKEQLKKAKMSDNAVAKNKGYDVHDLLDLPKHQNN